MIPKCFLHTLFLGLTLTSYANSMCPSAAWKILAVNKFISLYSADIKNDKGTCEVKVDYLTWWETMPTPNILTTKVKVPCYEKAIFIENGSAFINAFVSYKMTTDDCRANPGCEYSCFPKIFTRF